MSGVILVAEEMQRMDMTCRLKDADRVIQEMQKNHILFDKKYTTLRSKTNASTITFVNIRAGEIQKDVTTMIATLNSLGQMNQIDNVYIRFSPKEERRKPDLPPRKPNRFGPAAAASV